MMSSLFSVKGNNPRKTRLGLYSSHLRFHLKDSKGCMPRYLCPKEDGQKGGVSDHNFLLCPKPPTPKRDNNIGDQSTEKIEARKLGLTNKQEEFLAELMTEQREKKKMHSQTKYPQQCVPRLEKDCKNIQ